MYPGFYDPDKPAYIMASSNKCVTYGDLETASNQIAHLFRTLGLTRGDTIALCQIGEAWQTGESSQAPAGSSSPPR